MVDFLATSTELFNYYKKLAEKSFEQLSAEEMKAIPAEENNSIAIIIRHLHGNMLSRWTDFLESDGEKPFRNRDLEFESPDMNKQQLTECWNKGWNCLFAALNGLKEEDLAKIVYIRNEGHTVMQAILRQIAHYSYHVGQIVLLAKTIKGTQWVSLSIPKNKSAQYNEQKFLDQKTTRFFTGKA